MNFPDLLQVNVRNAKQGAPIANVAITVQLFAKRGNNYGVGPVVTDNAGIAQFSRADCTRAIETAQRMSIMDYQGTLADCKPWIEVRLHPPEQLATMLRQYREFPEFWGMAFNNPDTKMEELSKVDNYFYEPAVVIIPESLLINNPVVELQLIRSEPV